MKKTYLQPITETLVWRAGDVMIPPVLVGSNGEETPLNPINQTNHAPTRVF